MNLPLTQSERQDSPADFEGWSLDPAFLTRDDVPWLLSRIEELEWKLARRGSTAGRRPMRGGPPIEWDRWITGLPDKEFLDCLGPRSCDHPALHAPELTAATRELSESNRRTGGSRQLIRNS